MKRVSLAVFGVAALAIGAHYSWAARSAGYPFLWNQDLPGYYDQLGRAFAGGHLYLQAEPSPELLALPNPWDPAVGDSLKLYDAVLFHRRYYLYHGAGPAVMLFTPWRLITRHDLPENFALFLFCFGGFVFSAGTLISLINAKPLLLGALLAALGLCQAVPFLLSRVWVYEVAIGAGYFCVSAGVFCYVRKWWLAAGLMLGLAISCRPHLGVIGLILLINLLLRNRRSAAAFAIPFALAGLAVATYNYERFGNPLEFGNRYLLSAANQSEVKLKAANVVPGLFYLLLSPPVIDPVFPWILLPSPPHDFPRPVTYLVEPTVGALFLAPFLVLGACFGLRERRAWLLSLSAAAVLLFICATGWSTQRYEVDFLPLLVLAACASLGAQKAILTRAATIFLIGCGVVINMALAVSGPLDEMLKNRPDRFVKLAGWLTPLKDYRPALNPSIDVSFPAPHPRDAGSHRKILFQAGRMPLQYELAIESIGGSASLVSAFSGTQLSQNLPSMPANFRVTYSAGEIHVFGDGAALMNHKIGNIVAAPSQLSYAGQTRP